MLTENPLSSLPPSSFLWNLQIAQVHWLCGQFPSYPGSLVRSYQWDNCKKGTSHRIPKHYLEDTVLHRGGRQMIPADCA